MDAKTACELIKNAYTIITTDCEKYMLEEGKQVIKFIKQQEKDVELGRAAVEAANDMDAEPYCITVTDQWGVYGQTDCLEEKCCWSKFCRLRAERGVK